LNSFWIFKFVFVIAGSVLFALIPNGFFNVYAKIASVILGWFLLVQMVWIIDFGFSWNDLWVTNAAEDRLAGKSGKSWLIGILVFAVSFLIGAYVWYGFMYKGNSLNYNSKVILGVNVGVSTALGLVSVFSPRGGILPASLVVLYIAWLSWSILQSAAVRIVDNAQLGIGLTLAFVVLIYSSYKAGLPVTAAAAPVEDKSAAPAAAPEGAAPVQEAAMEEGKSKDAKPKETPEKGSCRYILFMNSMHLSAASYLMILCVSWSKSQLGAGNDVLFWVQAVAAWVMMLLYGWTLIAPLVCSNRQF